MWTEKQGPDNLKSKSDTEEADSEMWSLLQG